MRLGEGMSAASPEAALTTAAAPAASATNTTASSTNDETRLQTTNQGENIMKFIEQIVEPSMDDHCKINKNKAMRAAAARAQPSLL